MPRHLLRTDGFAHVADVMIDSVYVLCWSRTYRAACVLRPASADEVGAWLEGTRPDGARSSTWGASRWPPACRSGSMPALWPPHFLCGQSGWGKTYSLGVLLERLLMETNLRVVVLDPNSDDVRLGEPRVDDERYRNAAASVNVRGGSSGPHPKRVRFRDLSPIHQGGLLRLDPLGDRVEYGDLLALVEDESIRSLEDLAESPAEDLKLRARNLGIDRFGIGPGPQCESLLDELVSPAGPRCLVVDLGSLGTRDSRLSPRASFRSGYGANEGDASRSRSSSTSAERLPCGAGRSATALATEDAIRIAREGRKFGLYLIVVTQRPQKIHENVLSQCDNLVLLRMNSVADLAYVARVFPSCHRAWSTGPWPSARARH